MVISNYYQAIHNRQRSAMKAKISLAGKSIKKTSFPANWSPEKVLKKTCEALKNIYEIIPQRHGRFRLLGTAKGE